MLMSARVAPERTVTPAVLLAPAQGDLTLGGVMARKRTQRLTTAEFIERSRDVHGDRYDYSQSVYKNSRTKIKIVCPHHGVFFQHPGNHLRGAGCHDCGNDAKKVSQDEFLSRCKDAHGDRYDYSETIYSSANSNVTIICKEHGRFEQLAGDHSRGSHCPKCIGAAGLTKEDFVTRSIQVHGDRYDYSQSIFTGVSSHVTILCKNHGAFKQRAGHHMDGTGCPECANESVAEKLTMRAAESIIVKFQRIHGDKYDYSRFVYSGFYSKSDIICREHGVFQQSPQGHLLGYGCTSCGRISTGRKNRNELESWLNKFIEKHGDRYDYSLCTDIVTSRKITVICKEHGKFLMFPHHHAEGKICPECSKYGPDTQETAVRKFKKVHGDKYDYSRVKYTGTSGKVEIVCSKHGSFWQTAGNHIKGYGCRQCGIESRLSKPTKSVSKAEIEVRDYVASLGFSVDHGYLPGSDNKWTFDVIVPDKRIAIEYNGVYWHSYPKARRGQHYHKRKNAESAGYRLITIWEDDWRDNRARMQELIRRALHGPQIKIGARQTQVVRVASDLAGEFHEAYHVQPFAVKIAVNHYALFDQADMVAVASFDNAGTLHRYSILEGVSIAGGLRKLVAAFRRDCGNLPIVTFCDRDHFTGGVYRASGFVKQGGTLTMSYIENGRRVRREKYMKKKLSALFGDVDMSRREIDICAENGVYACWNSGTEKYLLDV